MIKKELVEIYTNGLEETFSVGYLSLLMKKVY